MENPRRDAMAWTMAHDGSAKIFVVHDRYHVQVYPNDGTSIGYEWATAEAANRDAIIEVTSLEGSGWIMISPPEVRRLTAGEAAAIIDVCQMEHTVATPAVLKKLINKPWHPLPTGSPT